jgi:hypothetical protein
MTDPDALSLDELEQVSDVPGRQIRELIRIGVLPAPSSRGRGATYGREHLERLRAWRRLRRESPPGTTNEQIRVLLDRLHAAGVLAGVAEGTVPLNLVDAESAQVSPSVAAFAVSTGSQLPPRPTRRNEAALAYLSAIPSVGSSSPPVAARLTLSRELTPTLEVDLGVSQHSTAGLLLDRLRAALDAFASGSGKSVRVNPPRSDAWHRVAVGRDLEISARAPLTPTEIQLLETVAQLLQQAIYQRDKQP